MNKIPKSQPPATWAGTIYKNRRIGNITTQTPIGVVVVVVVVMEIMETNRQEGSATIRLSKIICCLSIFITETKLQEIFQIIKQGTNFLDRNLKFKQTTANPYFSWHQ